MHKLCKCAQLLMILGIDIVEHIHYVFDGINAGMGKDTVRYAVQGYEKAYKQRAEHLSKCYTTRMSDLVTIKL